MPSLVPAGALNILTGALADHFDTFKQSVVIYTEPTKNIVQASANFIPGYANHSPAASYSNTINSGVFEALVLYKKFSENIVDNIGYKVMEGDAVMKVRDDAKNFIDSNKIQNVHAGSDVFNIISHAERADYITTGYYYYNLRYTK